MDEDETFDWTLLIESAQKLATLNFIVKEDTENE